MTFVPYIYTTFSCFTRLLPNCVDLNMKTKTTNREISGVHVLKLNSPTDVSKYAVTSNATTTVNKDNAILKMDVARYVPFYFRSRPPGNSIY